MYSYIVVDTQGARYIPQPPSPTHLARIHDTPLVVCIDYTVQTAYILCLNTRLQVLRLVRASFHCQWNSSKTSAPLPLIRPFERHYCQPDLTRWTVPLKKAKLLQCF